MEIMTIVIVVFAVIIGLVSLDMSASQSRWNQSQEAAELDAFKCWTRSNLIYWGQAEREADLLLNEAKSESKSLKEALLRLKRKLWCHRGRSGRWNLGQDVKNSSKSKVAWRRATSLDRKDDNDEQKKNTLEQRTKYFW